MEDRREKNTGQINTGAEREKKEDTGKESTESTERMERVKNMLIGDIYDKVFVPMSEGAGSADEAMNEKLMLLVAGADMEHMSEAKVADLICRGAVIGQKEGFISGVRFAAKLLCNMVEVQYEEVIDNNDTKREVLILETKEEPAAMRIRMDHIYKEYKGTQNLEESKRQILFLYRNRKQIPEEWLNYNWEQIRSRIRIRLVRVKGNETYLRSRPYRKVLDMAMIFVAVLQEDTESAAVPITWQHMSAWGIDTEELYRTAIENLEKEDFSLKDISSYFPQEMQEEFQGVPLFYVLTAENQVYGARAMLRKDILKAFADEKGRNLFILPSSLHEVLLLFDDERYNAKELAEMVCTINNSPSIICAEDILTDSVYYYDRESGEIRIAA